MAESIVHQSGIYEPFYCLEERYEGHLSALSEQMFPDYIWCDFKAEIWSEFGGVHADAALISRTYDQWYVVEVELSRHSWPDHIQPQLKRLLYGRFEKRHRQHLIERNPQLDPVKMSELDIYNPDIALIIESAPEYVRSWCRQNEIMCLQASLYRSNYNQYAFTLTGDRPNTRRGARARPAAATVKLSPTEVIVPQLTYVFDCPLANTLQQFDVQLGATRVRAQNSSDDPVKLVLACEIGTFLAAVGEAPLYDVVIIEQGVYQITPRS